MHKPVPEYVFNRIQAACSVGELATTAQEYLNDLGFSRSVYNFGRQLSKDILEKTHVASIFTNYPYEWHLRYTECDYFRHDIVLAHSLSTVVPYTWKPLQRPDISAMALRIFNEARDFRLYDGISLPLRSGHLYSHLTCVPDGTEREQGMIMGRNTGTLMYLEALLHEKATGLLELEELSSTTGASISPRERETLKWVARGKTSQDISDILKIAKPTIDQHIVSSMQKLEATSRSHAVVKAMVAGLIDPV